MGKVKILIIEDEIIVALDIKSALIEFGYEVTDIVTNYDSAIESVKSNKPDMLLTDIRLENSKDGIQTAHDIQKIQKIPIIYLTAFFDEATINRAIKTNPIVYILKPFKREELKANLTLTLHTIDNTNKYKISHEHKKLGFDFYFDEKNKNLYMKNILIKLGQKEKELLSILVEAKGRVVSIENLEHLIWTDGPVSDSTVRTLIYRLRAKLEYRLIETIPYEGVKLTFDT